jgi:Polyketide cyclase / dehydrase and lipid transport
VGDIKRVTAWVAVPGRAAEADALWLDEARWASWVDGFASVVRRDPEWPASGARLRWTSVPRGRGLVEERVLEHVRGRRFATAVEDERLRGTQTVTFAEGEDDVRVTLTLEYELKSRAAPLVDRFFVRRALADSLRRTVTRFGHERRAELEPLR